MQGEIKMLRSMTGFGRGENVTDEYSIQVQIKSVNHRYSDVSVRLPRLYGFLEDKIRRRAAEEISRGKTEISVSIERKDGSDKAVTLNRALAAEYTEALRGLSEFGISDDLTMSAMLRLPDIFDVEYKEIEEDKLWEQVCAALECALADFNTMRGNEGRRLGENLRQHLGDLLKEVEAVEERSPKCVEEYRARLTRRLNEVLEDKSIDEARIVAEAAIFADKTAVDEETVRLRSHICAFEEAMAAVEPIGKKLDFIVQEMNREANTIGSKCSDAEAAAHVVEMKSIIEKIREQIQNIE